MTASGGAWRAVAAAVIGSDHVRAGLPCQDVAVVRVVSVAAGERLVVVVSDGAGSARLAEVGARLACEAGASFLAAAGALDVDARGCGAALVAAVQAAIEAEATACGAVVRDFACTLLAVAVDLDGALFVQVGDGGMVAGVRGEGGGHQVVFWPDKGEYANETSFVTGATAAERVEVRWWGGAIDEVAVFSDGLERLALDFEARAAHQAFFAPMFALMEGLPAGDAAASEALGAELAAFLGSARVNARTSDDKTLVLATRRVG